MANRFNMDQMIKSGVTYTPDTFNEIMFTPLQYRAREDAMNAELLDLATKNSQLIVPDNDIARDMFSKFKDTYKTEVDSLVSELSKKGSADPNLTNRLIQLKKFNNEQLGENGKIGNLIKLQTQIDAQRSLRASDAASKGHSTDSVNNIYKAEVNDYFNNNLEKFQNDPNYVLPTFQARFAPKYYDMNDFIRERADLLGSISNALKDNQITAVPGEDGSITLNEQNASHSNSSNIENLKGLLERVNMEIKDDNSPLLLSEYYKAGIIPEKATPEQKDEIKRKLYSEVMSYIQMMRVESNVTDKSKSIEYMAGNPAPIMDMGSPNGSSNSNSSSTGNDSKSEGDLANNATLTISEQGSETLKLTQSDLVFANSATFHDNMELMEKTGKFFDSNGKPITEQEFAKMKNMYNLIRMNNVEELDALLKSPGEFSKVGDEALDKITTMGGSLNAKYVVTPGVLANDYDFNYSHTNSGLMRAGEDYKITGVGTVKEVFTNSSKFKAFIQKRDEIRASYNSKRDITAKLNNKLSPKDALIMNNFYDYQEDVANTIDRQTRYKTIYATVNNKTGQIMFGRADFSDKKGEINRGGQKYYVGKDSIEKLVAQQAGISTQEAKNYLSNRTNVNLFDKIESSFRVGMVQSKNNGEYKVNTESYAINSTTPNGVKLAKNINTGFNEPSFKKALFSAASNGASETRFTGVNSSNSKVEGVTLEEAFSKDINAFEKEWSDAKIEFEGIFSVNSMSKPKIGIKLIKGEGQNRVTSSVYIPYIPDGKNKAIEDAINGMKSQLAPTDKAKLQAMLDNTKYNYLYSDLNRFNESGTSRHQFEKLNQAVKAELKHNYNEEYKKTMPIFNGNYSEASIHFDTTGNYLGINVRNKSDGKINHLSAGSYSRKEMLVLAQNSGTIGTLNQISKDPTEFITDPHKLLLFSQMINISEQLRAGVIKIEGVDYLNNEQFKAFVNKHTSSGNSYESIDGKYEDALILYNFIKDKKIYHRSALGLVK